MGMSSSVFGLELRSLAVACFGSLAKGPGRSSPVGSGGDIPAPPRGGGAWPPARGLYLTFVFSFQANRGRLRRSNFRGSGRKRP